MSETLRRCTKCGESKPLDAFGKHRTAPGGLNWWCKACNIANAKRYMAENPERMRERYKRQWQKYRETHPPKPKQPPMTVEERRAKAVAYRLKVRERMTDADYDRKNEQVRAWRAKRREIIRQRQLEYTRADREKHRDKWRARWAVSAAVATGKLPRVSTLSCVDCGSPATRYDHYMGYAPENRLDVQPVCNPCDGKRERARGERRVYA